MLPLWTRYVEGHCGLVPGCDHVNRVFFFSSYRSVLDCCSSVLRRHSVLRYRCFVALNCLGVVLRCQQTSTKVDFVQTLTYCLSLLFSTTAGEPECCRVVRLHREVVCWSLVRSRRSLQALLWWRSLLALWFSCFCAALDFWCVGFRCLEFVSRRCVVAPSRCSLLFLSCTT